LLNFEFLVGVKGRKPKVVSLARGELRWLGKAHDALGLLEVVREKPS
jgi:hypothetical protein